ncbi:hypothetical protein [Actinomyces procaprae]|uniref:hypothetical protein n=1 Tax=Actinomyces procaprae TaxID=2560010 RepID=UPI0010A2249B|nr:hypothetical protein [Actinomyces procaprae]
MSHPLDVALRPLTLPPPRGPIPHGLMEITSLVGQVADGWALRTRTGNLETPYAPAVIQHRRWLLDQLTYRCALWAHAEDIDDPVTAIRDTYDAAPSALSLDEEDMDDYERMRVLVDALGRVAHATPALDLADALVELAMHAATWATTITTQEQP